MNIFEDISTYAWRGSGKYLLITCSVLAVFTDIIAFAPLLGLLASISLGGYFCAVYFHIIQSTATGGKEAPEFPETTNFHEDIISPWLQVMGVLIVSFGPFVGYEFLAGKQSIAWVKVVLLLTGLVYFPMAMLAVAVLGHIGAVSPRIVVPALLRGGWIYWGGVVLLAALLLTLGFCLDLLSRFMIVGPLVAAFISAWVLMTNARIIGVVYRERENELNWL